MNNMASRTNWIFLCAVFLLTLQSSFALFDFKCLDREGEAPKLPDAYSTNIMINFLLQEYTMEVKYATIGETNKELIEVKTKNKHAKYITTGEGDVALYLEYKKDEAPTCKVIKSKNILENLDDEFAGSNRIFAKAVEVMMYPNDFDLYSTLPYTDVGVISKRYDGCLTNPKINVSMVFAVDTWSQPRFSSLIKDVKYPVVAVAEIEKVYMMALYSNFDPTMPDDALFQPPEDVYCEGYRADKKPPKINDYFSYNSEVIVYESSYGLAPIVSYRQVYYDYPSRISRMDFHDALSDDADLFSKVWAQRKSIIHDYKGATQYILNPVTGKCTIDDFQATFSVLSVEETTKDNKMLQGNEYFWLDTDKTSYNGQYRINGKPADVYTSTKVDPRTKRKVVISWAFATEKTRVVGNEKVEKNVLLRMYVRPENVSDFDGVTQINFYNFVNEEPNVFTYDISSCFNDTSSKTLVLTFPGNDSLKGYEKFIGVLTHRALNNTIGIRKHRIILKEVISSGKYIYAEFTIVEDSPVKGNGASKDIPVDEALDKLRKAIDAGKFYVDVPVFGKKGQIISLRPEPDGLNIFAGDRRTKPSVEGYNEGSVISLTIGMLLLGILLGGVTLNLIMSKKFGISLFQKSRSGDEIFNNPLNESSM